MKMKMLKIDKLNVKVYKLMYYIFLITFLAIVLRRENKAYIKFVMLKLKFKTNKK
jgi:hypothetical protein